MTIKFLRYSSQPLIWQSKTYFPKDYGPVKQLQLACRVDPVNDVYMLQGFKARHGPKPGSARYQWTDLHGSAEGPPGAPGTIIENWSMGKVSKTILINPY